MLTGRRSLYRAWAGAGLFALSAAAWAQDATSDQAKLLLQQGLAQYKALDFKQAQATLLKVTDLLKQNAAALSAAEKKDLDNHLAKVPNSIRQQAAAQEAYRSAEKALATSAYDEAIQGFARAVASTEFLDEATRRDARAQLALAQRRKEVAAAAAPHTQQQKRRAPVAQAPLRPQKHRRGRI